MQKASIDVAPSETEVVGTSLSARRRSAKEKSGWELGNVWPCFVPSPDLMAKRQTGRLLWCVMLRLGAARKLSRRDEIRIGHF